jgi:hypothetical protein
MVMQRVLILLVVIGAAIANAGATQVNDAAEGAGQADAATLLQYYPTPLATSPVGAIEDKAVWLAKVQGLIATAPPLLRQSMLASTNQQDFDANLTLLEQLQQGTLQKGVTAAKSLAKSGKVVKAADGKIGPNLGSGPADTVFTYLEPCRIMDTRRADVDSGIRGPLIGNQLYQLHGFLPQAETQNWGAYGGNATSDCGLNIGVGANIWALAIVITILNPNFDSFLGVGDKGTLAETLSTVALNYTHGQGLSTQYIVPQGIVNTIYFAMPAQLSANIIFDVVGYFAVSQATKLDCVYLTSVGSGSVADGAFAFATVSPACPDGYSITGTACNSTYISSLVPLTYSGLLLASGNNTCSWINKSGVTINAQNVSATSACCRIPGR